MNEMQDPLVSICCITYNHEKYIGGAIEGFIQQKTTFPLEIIIHDDASTDGTADIVREYEKKYPDIVKPIYQVENQYSKGTMIPDILTFQQAKGKYIAICEGDDYWIDPLKLQKQITEMEKHPECHISFHPAFYNWNDGTRKDDIINQYSKKNKIFPIQKVIEGGGGFIPTASIVLNNSVIPRIISFFTIAKNPPYGDYYLQVLGAENGGALYLKDIMCAYRRNVVGSWSDTMSKNSDYLNSEAFSYIDTFSEIDAFTGSKFSKQFTFQKNSFILHVLLSEEYEPAIQEKIFNLYWTERCISESFIWNRVIRRPNVVKTLRTMKGIKDRVKRISTDPRSR